MAVGGIGSRSSPIVIDDDDDDGLPPPRAKVDSNSSKSPKETPPQQSILADIAGAWDPTPTRQENQLTSGKGYSILIRMGYKPGHGLGVNLEGVTSPIKAHVRPQRSPTGLGASNVTSSRNRPPANASNAGPSSSGSQTIAPISEHARETSSSLSADASTSSRRRSSGHGSKQEHRPNSLLEKNPYDNGSSVLPGVDLGLTDGSESTHAGRIRKVNTVKTPTKRRPDSHHPTSPQDVGKARSLDSRAPHASPNDSPYFPFPTPSSIPSISSCLPPRPVDYRDSALINLPLNSIDPYSRPIHLNPPSSSLQQYSIPYVTRLKSKNVVLGMPLDDTKAGGMRGTFLKILEPPPSPFCSLVMEILPRKFRTKSFILDWLSQFTFKPRRYELVEGKVFFEFETERDARFAWSSPRMGGLEGLFGVRLFWYRVLPQTALDAIRNVNATGTIENSAQSRLQPVSDSSTDGLGLRSGFKADLSHSHISTQKAASPSPSSSPSTVIQGDSGLSVHLNAPAEGSRSSNSDSQKSHCTSSEHFPGDSTVPSPTVTTRPLAAPMPLSDPPDNRMAVDYVNPIGDPPPGGVPGFVPGAIAPPTVVTTSLSPTSSFSHSLPSIYPTFSPEVLNSSVITKFVDHQAPPALHQGLMQASNLAAETLHAGMEDKGIEFEKVDGTPLGADDFMETTDAVALAKEQALREMVLQSRKRKLLEPSSTKQPPSATTSSATSRNALEDLATNFIADAIARPRPAKIVRITPSPSAMAAWGKRLEQHVESSKALMAKIQLTRSKAERNRLLAVLREKDWIDASPNSRIEKEKMSLFSCPVEEVVPVSPWPESHPDQGILELSDTDEEGDYGSDDDME